MSSHNKTRRLVLMSLLIALAMSLSVMERVFPMPVGGFPGLKLGLANIITMTAIYYFKPREAFTIVILRVMLTALIVGNMMSFFYSLAGGILSYLGMVVLFHMFGEMISLIGISVVGAVLHNVGQLMVLTFAAGKLTIALTYSPLLMITGIATGIFVGIASKFFIQHTRRLFRFDVLNQ